jgi:hypothetical protein
MFSFNADTGSTPPGWARIEIRLGDHVETSLAQIGEWSEQDYVDHWEEARLACLRGDPFVVFCSSRSASADDLTTLLIARRTETGYRFFNCLVPPDDVQFFGKVVSLSDYADFGPGHDSNVSKWDVALADISRRKA